MSRSGRRSSLARLAILATVPWSVGWFAPIVAAGGPPLRKPPRVGYDFSYQRRGLPTRQPAAWVEARSVIAPEVVDPGFVVPRSADIDPAFVVVRSAEIDPRIVAYGRVEADRR